MFSILHRQPTPTLTALRRLQGQRRRPRRLVRELARFVHWLFQPLTPDPTRAALLARAELSAQAERTCRQSAKAH